MQTEKLEKLVIDALEDLKASNITVLDIHKMTSIADEMIICSARSTRHLKALADSLIEKAKAAGARPLSTAGEPQSGWILVDLNDIIVHIMLPETREFYNLEKLWSSDNEE